jgi:hypothetical protein
MSWSNETKIPSRTDRGRILTPDGDQILVGQDEDLVLIYQEDRDLWDRLQKNTD